ncbi:hypothetical protein GCM10027615_66010 [Plantactinospora veratri]
MWREGRPSAPADVPEAFRGDGVSDGVPIAQVRRYTELVRQGEITLAERLALLEEDSREVEERTELLCHQYAHLQDKIAWYRGQLDRLRVSRPGRVPPRRSGSPRRDRYRSW